MTSENVHDKIRRAKDTNAQSLDLSSMSLAEIPPEVWLLGALERLDISGNRISILPHDISRLLNLRELYACDNRLADFPRLTGLAHLNHLCLAGNYLTDADHVEELSSLQTIDLQRNRLGSIPGSLAGMQSLRELNVDGNYLADLGSILSSPTLETFSANANQIVSVPILGPNSTLKHLSLSQNSLQQVPQQIVDVRGLTELDLSDNMLVDIAPIAWIQTLKIADLSSNKIEDIAPLCHCKHLEELWISNNIIRWVPESFAYLDELDTLWLANNRLSRADALSNLRSLKRLSLRDNYLETLPSCSQWTKLTHLEVGGNRLRLLSDDLALLPLRTFRAERNRLVTIPRVLPISLKELELHNNRLTSIPDEFVSLSSLELLTLDNNRISDLSPPIRSLIKKTTRVTLDENPLAHEHRALGSDIDSGQRRKHVMRLV